MLNEMKRLSEVIDARKHVLGREMDLPKDEIHNHEFEWVGVQKEVGRQAGRQSPTQPPYRHGHTSGPPVVWLQRAAWAEDNRLPPLGMTDTFIEDPSTWIGCETIHVWFSQLPCGALTGKRLQVLCTMRHQGKS